MAEDGIVIASQNLALATRLKSEAESRLKELADSKGGGRKAPVPQLSDKDKLSLRARMTRGATRANQ